MSSNNNGQKPFETTSTTTQSNAESAGTSNKRRLSVDEECDSNSSNSDVEWIEESSESDSECECLSWDNDCVVIPINNRKQSVRGYHLMPTCARERKEIEPRLKLYKSYVGPLLNANLITDEFKTLFMKRWHCGKHLQQENIELIVNPFKLGVFNEFLADGTILHKIREEMYEMKWKRRSLDLYEFFQSADLVTNNSTNTVVLYEFLKLQVMPWIEAITGLELNKISATCSAYTDTDYLLLHDDHQDDRLVAFVLYLTDPNSMDSVDDELWTKDMGGALELFAKGDDGHPTKCVRELFPKNNQFVFFQVTNDSYHRVAEVLTKDYCRYSINGWFHAKEPPVFNLPPLRTPTTGIFSDNYLQAVDDVVPLADWISPMYLKSKFQKQIQEHIEERSEISLQDFLDDEKLGCVFEAIERNDILWNPVGPPNRRQYYVADEETLPNIIQTFLSLFKSSEMFAFLQACTDLDLNSMKYELQKWTPGCYSLLSEYNWENENELDLVMYLSCPENVPIVGGQTMYVSTEDVIQNALITLEPKDNCLNIVYRDTARIIKNVSKRSVNHCYYMLICCYKE